MKILLPNSTPLDPQIPDAELIVYSCGEPIPAEHTDADVLVAWGNTAAELAEMAGALPELKLVQGLHAGPDLILNAGFTERAVLCSGVGLHTSTVTEHALALILSLVRRLPASREAQERHEWSRELGMIQPLHPETGPITTLLKAKVTIWGFGAIAQRLAFFLRELGAEVTGVARTPGERAGFPVVTSDSLATVLPGTDLLVMLLPHQDDTRHALSAEVLALLKESAYLVNVGRGSTVDEEALVAALRAKKLAGAALDVTEVEPLPADSPLWDEPGVVITPHAAGGRPVEAERLIERNVAAVRGDGELVNRVR